MRIFFLLLVLCMAPACQKEAMKNILEEVPATEDLMREHGLLNRTLIIYDTFIEEIKAGKPFDKQVLLETAQTIQAFVHNYHEKLEEQHIFPIFEKAGKMVEMVTTLREQHQVGRAITDSIIKELQAASLSPKKLLEQLENFVAMYRAHESREDTELFPLVRSLITVEQFEAISDSFEESEDKLFGEHGFEKVLDRVGELERKLGIHELDLYTPDKA